VIFKRPLNRIELSNEASGRACLYGSLVKVFGNIPDDAFLIEIKSYDLQFSLDNIYIRVPELKPSIDRIRLFSSESDNLQNMEIIETLFVDRDNIIVGLSKLDFSQTAESLLRSTKDKYSQIMNVTYFPLQAEEMLENNICNLLDHLCIELDYMNYLCRQEQKQWRNEKSLLITINQEADFLRNDLSGSTGVFCLEAKKHAKTDFYGGFLEFMEGYVKSDLCYLNDLLLKL
jgi:hypothetical protein